MQLIERGVPGSGRTEMLGSRARRVATAFMLVLLAWAATLVFSGAPALAANGHKYLSSLTEAPPGTPLGEPQSVAVDPPSGDVFVADAAAGAVDRFSSSGAYQTQFGGGTLGVIRGLAVDSSTGDVYVADSAAGVVDVFKPSGPNTYELVSQWTGANTPGLVFGEPVGVAVDSSTGKVYVVDSLENVVDVFNKPKDETKEGEFTSTLTGAKPALAEPGAVAVSAATHKVYVSDGPRETVEIFNSSGAFESLLIGKGTPTKEFGEVGGVAVDEATGDVYVTVPELEVQEVGQGVVQQFNKTNEWIGWLKAGAGGKRLAEPHGVAVSATGHVYVAETGGGVVDEFGANGVVPDVVTGKSSAITRTSATISGTINALGTPATYHFEWGTSEELGNSTEVTSAGASEEIVTATVTGLEPGTEYFYRLVGESENGANYGLIGPKKAEVSGFVTAPAVTKLVTLPASAVEPNSATLNGSFKPEGLATKYHFEYGETESYGKSSPIPDGETSAAGKTTVPVTTSVSGLSPNTTYHFRLSAANEFGTTLGFDERFTTAGPPRITSTPTTAIGHTSATINALINPDRRETTYHFEYGETTSYGTSTPEAKLAAGEKPEPVKAEVEGLKLATTYHFRVIASNAAGEVAGPDQEFTTVLIESASAKEVTGEGATLQAQINPLGVDTTYHFEYGQTTSYGTSIPVPDEDVGNGEVDKGVQQTLVGLLPGTTYHYRVVATVEGLGTAASPDHSFTTHATGGAPALPDGRAYEMVSPPDKRGGYIEPLTASGGAIQASEDGNALAYVVDGPIVEDPEGNRSPEAQQVISTRDPSTWSSQEIVTPHDRPWGLRPGIPPEYQLFSSDLALGLVQPFPNALTPLAEPPLAPPLSEAERGHQEKTMYLRENAPIAPAASEAAIYDEAKQNGEALAHERGEAKASPGYLPLVTAANVPPGTKFGGVATTSTAVIPNLTFQSATPDLSHVVLNSSGVALATEPPAAPGLYEWSGGKLQFVSVLPSGSPPAVGEVALGFAIPGQGAPVDYRHALSDDGSRVVWSNNETGFKGLGHLYVRDTSKGETAQVDAPEKGLTEAEKGEAHFQIASADGSKVFFTDTQRLTANSAARPEQGGKPAKPDLYECEVIEVAGKLACKLSDLTPEHNSGESAAVQGLVLGAAQDGSYVYFVATGELTQGEGAISGANNLYVLHNDGTGWTTRFIRRLSSEDAPDWFDPNLGSVLLITQPTRVSPSGRYLAFMSNRSLTGYDNTDVNEETGRHADEEVFLYDASSEGVSCPSCNPTGARPRGVFDTQRAGEGRGLVVDRPGTWAALQFESKERVAHWLAGSIPGWTAISTNRSFYQSRYLSNSGRLFFNSADPLVREAGGHTRKETIEGREASVGVENVYQYEPNGVGSCKRISGCVALISSGTSEKESAFLDASASGDDVFFLTAAAVLPQDQDTAFDVYDARVCSESSPCQTAQPQPPEACTTAASCKEGSSSLPTFEAPPSSTVTGSGNLVPAAPKRATLPTKTTALTRAQKLTKALTSCRKHFKHNKKKRAACETRARKKYGPKHSAKKKGQK